MAESQTTQTLSPQVLSAINAHLRQVRASGRPVTDADIRAAYAAALDVEAGRALQSRGQAIQQEQWNKQYKLQKEALKDQRQANTMTGIATIGGALWQMGGKEAITGGLKSMFGKKPIAGVGGAQTQIAPGTATLYQGNTPIPAIATQPTGIASGVGDPVPSNMTPSASGAVPAVGAGQGGAMEFAKDWALPGAIGSGIGYGVKSLTGSTGWGVAAGAGVGAIGGYMAEGDVVQGLVGGLLGGMGGLF